MTEKNERPADQPEKEGKFTGTPEEQLPDLEAEDTEVPEDQQANNDKDE